MPSVAVFCASSDDIDERYAVLAGEVGFAIARRGWTLVSGGGSVSCMGAVARAARAGGAHTIGVIPRALVELEVADHGADELVITDDMRERKGEMDRRSDAFLTLPGGIGTLEEIFEQWTWAQLGIHAKPCGFLNAGGYFDPLLAMIARMTSESFLSEAHAQMVLVDDQIEQLIDRFADYCPPPLKWTGGQTEAIEP